MKSAALAAAIVAIAKIERGQQPTTAELSAADLCVKCAGFGFVDYADDGFTEVPCDLCSDKDQ